MICLMITPSRTNAPHRQVPKRRVTRATCLATGLATRTSPQPRSKKPKLGNGNRRGAAKRSSHSFSFKRRAIEHYDFLVSITANDKRSGNTFGEQLDGKIASAAYVAADLFGINPSLMSKWKKRGERAKVEKCCAKGANKVSLATKQAHSSTHKCCPADAAVMAEFRRLRALKRRLGKRWLFRRHKMQLRKQFPDAPLFKGSGS